MSAEYEVGQFVLRGYGHRGGGAPDYKRTKVSRVTKTFVECEDGSKWTLRGYRWGSPPTTWGNSELIHVERPGEWEEVQDLMRQDRAHNRVLGVRWRDLPIEAVYEVCAVLDKYTKKAPDHA